MRPLFVLFLSTGNAARSLIAESLLNAKKSDRFIARSAGFEPCLAPDPETLALLTARGIPTEKLHCKGWEEFLAASRFVKVDIVVTLSEEARDSTLAWPDETIHVHWDLDNPLGAERAEVREWKFRKCFNTLDTRIQQLVRSRPGLSMSELFLQLKEIGMVV